MSYLVALPACEFADVVHTYFTLCHKTSCAHYRFGYLNEDSHLTFDSFLIFSIFLLTEDKTDSQVICFSFYWGLVGKDTFNMFEFIIKKTKQDLCCVTLKWLV